MISFVVLEYQAKRLAWMCVSEMTYLYIETLSINSWPKMFSGIPLLSMDSSPPLTLRL